MSNTKKPGTGVTNKRRKELAAAKAERQRLRRAQRAAAHRRRMQIGWSIAAIVAMVAIAVAVWPAPERTGDDVALPSESASPVQVDGCEAAPTPPSDPQSWDSAPAMELGAGEDPQLVLDTNCGQVVIDTAADDAPETVNAMLWLAGEGYFDSTLCHRLTTEGILVLQCGDPTATGTGGPGFVLPDENLPADEDANYPAGTVAMANAGAGTSGSQFFIVYGDTTLPPSYTIWGEVRSGLDVVEKVAAAGVQDGGTDGAPAAPIGILTASSQPQG